MADSRDYTGLTKLNLAEQLATDGQSVTTAATFNSFDSSQSFAEVSGSTVAIAINGIEAGIDGQHLYIVSLGTGNMTIAHQNTSATAVDRIITMTGSDVATTGNGAAHLIYSESQSRWLLINSQA